MKQTVAGFSKRDEFPYSQIMLKVSNIWMMYGAHNYLLSKARELCLVEAFHGMYDGYRECAANCANYAVGKNVITPIVYGDCRVAYFLLKPESISQFIKYVKNPPNQVRIAIKKICDNYDDEDFSPKEAWTSSLTEIAMRHTEELAKTMGRVMVGSMDPFYKIWNDHVKTIKSNNEPEILQTITTICNSTAYTQAIVDYCLDEVIYFDSKYENDEAQSEAWKKFKDNTYSNYVKNLKNKKFQLEHKPGRAEDRRKLVYAAKSLIQDGMTRDQMISYLDMMILG